MSKRFLHYKILRVEHELWTKYCIAEKCRPEYIKKYYRWMSQYLNCSQIEFEFHKDRSITQTKLNNRIRYIISLLKYILVDENDIEVFINNNRSISENDV